MTPRPSRAVLAARSGVVLVAVISGCVGAAAGCAPVGSSGADRVLTGFAAAAVTFAAAGASGAVLAVGAAAVVAAGGSWELHVAGLVALAAIALIERSGQPWPGARAVVGAVIVQALLRLPWTSPARGSAAVAFVVMALIAISGVRRAPARIRRVALISAAVVGTLALAAILASAYAVARSRSLLETGETAARAGVDAARSGDRVAAADDFAEAGKRFDAAANRLGSWMTLPARQLPIVGPQMRTLDTIARLGARTIPLARSAATNINPDRLRLVNGRLDLATLASYRPTFDRLAAQTRLVRTELGRLPRTWLIPALERQLVRFEATVIRADESAQTADEAVRLAPALLGGSGVRTYFVAFVTPAEARGSGGLMANYGILTASGGRLRLGKVGRGPDLNFGTRPKHLTGPAEYLARYGKFQPAQTWENVTMSPDFPSVAQVMAQLYPQSGGTRVDGVISVDPYAMAQLLSLTGPVRVAGIPVTLDANNAVSFLLRDEYTLITDPILRSNLLGDVARAVFDRLTTGQSAQPSRMAQALSAVTRTENLALWFRDSSEQQFVRRIGADAGLPAVRGDSFGVIVQNGGGNKIDNFLQRTVRYAATVTAATGAVRTHAVVALHNSSPTSGVPLYVIGNALGQPAGTNTLYLSIYSRFALTAATLDGKPLKLLAERELGRNVYSSFVEIPAGATRTIALDLEGSVDLTGRNYRFDYIAQVLPNPDRVSWTARFDGARAVPYAGGGELAFAVDPGGATARVERSGDRGPWTVDVRLRR
ncbi:MAG TPA: DUF4012 domain-containing protein [Acidimicrobiia bacterium]|nr:DUF4012 domain-containing protein [Acidimicrobiia bacterium]